MAKKAKAVVATEPILEIEPEDMLVMLGKVHSNDALARLAEERKALDDAVKEFTIRLLKEVKELKAIREGIEL